MNRRGGGGWQAQVHTPTSENPEARNDEVYHRGGSLTTHPQALNLHTQPHPQPPSSSN